MDPRFQEDSFTIDPRLLESQRTHHQLAPTVPRLGKLSRKGSCSWIHLSRGSSSEELINTKAFFSWKRLRRNY